MGIEYFKKAVCSLEHTHLEPNEVLFRAGDKGDKFYIILAGSVGVYIKLPSLTDPS